ncbi:ribosome maturation factor RimP [Selenihalanaerobacter shriftii]|uniref:Ribosome maturation factor RimP n=1 Tax=Selenihalanaerobacter shriftii TaxID=142842 RepID=A0A1T4JNP2_9FIRM|nr:ribosome maturation factor RimP [Selenihalanaerobacter shriftii]SJZ31779.1 ribosome maturation factor RimP [Selenihalanaerobacter shriftii]
MGKKTEDYVFDLAQPIIKEEELELVDVEYQKEGQNWILRIFIDDEAGITLENCQNVSKEISNLLDIEDLIEDSYILEVSSPGLDRPLKKDEDFIRFSGHLVDISTYAPVDGSRSFTGELLGMHDDKVKLKTDDNEVIEIPRAKIAKANLALDF